VYPRLSPKFHFRKQHFAKSQYTPITVSVYRKAMMDGFDNYYSDSDDGKKNNVDDGEVKQIC
jgi:hypothetical protein